MATQPANPLASGVTAELYRAAIGPGGQDYYLRHFTRFDTAGKAGLSWHWPAYWNTFNWLAYRRMWGWALAYAGALLGLVLLIFGIGKLLLDYDNSTALLLFLLLLTAAFAVPGLYANAWFYTHLNEKISAALRNTSDVPQASEVLARQAPDRQRLLWIALANAGVLGLAALAVYGLQDDGFFETRGTASGEQHVSAAGQSGQILPLTPPPPPAPPLPPPVPAPVPLVPPVAAPDATPVAAPSAAPAEASAPASGTPATGAAGGNEPASPLTEVARAQVPVAGPAVKPLAAEPAGPVPPAPPPVSAVVEPPAAPAIPPVVAQAASPSKPRPVATAPRTVYVWVLQVGAYAESENTERTMERLRTLGLDSGAIPLQTPDGWLMRVRVGPFERRADAERELLRIQSAGLPVLMLRQRP